MYCNLKNLSAPYKSHISEKSQLSIGAVTIRSEIARLFGLFWCQVRIWVGQAEETDMLKVMLI